MKKNLVLLILCFMIGSVFAQTNSTVDINDDVYYLLKSAETENLCGHLETIKPYTQSYIVKKLNEVLDNLYQEKSSEANENKIEIVQKYLKKYEKNPGVSLKTASFRIENNNENFPTSFEFHDTFQGYISGGIYKNNNQSSYGYEFFNNFNVLGDLGKKVSYRATAYMGITCMPLEELGTYDIGQWWFNRTDPVTKRTIKTFRNNSVLPYAYNKYWDGSIYYLTNLSSSGLEGWPGVMSLAFGMFGEVFGSFGDGRIEIGVNRLYREWSGMDDGSSLVLNANARPFFGCETRFHIIDGVSISAVTGVLEFPNQDYMNDDALYLIDDNGNRLPEVNEKDTSKVEDYYFFQNAFSLGKMDITYKNWYLDFGSACVWPKRFEMGYGFPFIDRVIYQNSLGDYDNLSLFGDIKYTKPGFGSFWFSAYLDEVSQFKIKFWEKSRAMFAAQAGTKINLPFLPFGTLSFRYTKVEPYCYTHHSINYTSWFDHYICESYTNNGYSLGYYLQPNSDEFNLKIETIPSANSKLSFQYQLIRHGVDWGSGAGIYGGNNLYSELSNTGRDDFYKYFLKDGTYEWSNIITLFGSYKFNQSKTPVMIYASLGYIYDWFTTIGDSEPGWNTDYHYINNDEYSDKHGIVLSVGFKIF